MNYIKSGLLVAITGLVYSLSADALVFNVNNTQDVPDATPGDGICNPINALPGICTLRAAIMEANATPNGHNIVLASGNYVLTNTGLGENGGVTGDLDIHGTMRISSSALIRPTISGSFDDRVFDIHATGWLQLEDIDVGAGMANFPGTTRGGAFNVRATASDTGFLTLIRSNVSSNIANQGGAIYSDGDVTIMESEFFFNVITDDHVLPEFADGAAILSRGDLKILRSTFRSNGVIPGGDGQFLTAEYAVHSKAGVTENPSTFVSDSTFYDNTNGIFSDAVRTIISSCTIVDNNQRGLRFLRDLGSLGDLQLSVDTTVIVGHSSDCSQIPSGDPEFNIASNVNASSDESCGFTGFNSFQNIEFPFKGDAGNNGGPTSTFMPRFGSVLIDPIGSDCASSLDQRRFLRVQDGDNIGGALCDIGAVEITPAEADALFSDGYE